MGVKVIVGNLIAGRLQALYREKWVPLAVILGAGHDSPYYNEKNKAGSLYNEGWALVHMLALNQEYRPKFNCAFECDRESVALDHAFRADIRQAAWRY